jgi:RimJ/RimL family protein N-acetyltransferase
MPRSGLPSRLLWHHALDGADGVRVRAPRIQGSIVIRPLTPDDVSAFIAYEEAMRDVSGRVELHHGPFPAGEPMAADLPAQTRTRMEAAIGTDGWRRFWGAFDGDELVGVAYADGGHLAAESHRCDLGIGVLPSYRRRGLARELLRSVVSWCRSEPTLEWLDLGVFGHNPGAIELYKSEGFVKIGRTPDRFRVDGIRIDDISMTLLVD